MVFVDACVLALDDGELTVEDAAKAEWWCTELQERALAPPCSCPGGKSSDGSRACERLC